MQIHGNPVPRTRTNTAILRSPLFRMCFANPPYSTTNLCRSLGLGAASRSDLHADYAFISLLSCGTNAAASLYDTSIDAVSAGRSSLRNSHRGSDPPRPASHSTFKTHCAASGVLLPLAGHAPSLSLCFEDRYWCFFTREIAMGPARHARWMHNVRSPRSTRTHTSTSLSRIPNVCLFCSSTININDLPESTEWGARLQCFIYASIAAM